MDYNIFDQKEILRLVNQKSANQECMTLVFKKLFCKNYGDGKRINDLVNGEYLSSDYEHMTLQVGFSPSDWELNPNGTVHGGIIATCIDLTCGALARFIKKSNQVVTVQLSVEYLRTIHADEYYIVSAKANKNGRSVVFIETDVFSRNTGKILAKATAIFMHSQNDGTDT